MATVHWTSAARSDLTIVRDYLAQYSVDRAIRLTDDIDVAVRRLAMFPLSGRKVPEFDLEWLREIIHRDYRILYEPRLDRDEVWILAVYHAARDIARHLEQRWSTE